MSNAFDLIAERMLDISVFTGGMAQTNGYLVDTGNGVLLVDAPEGVANWLASRGERVDALLLTHQHFDHVLDAAAVQTDHGCPVYAFAQYSPDLTLETLFGAVTGLAVAVQPFAVDHVLSDQSELELLNQTWQLLHIPGHASDSLCFYQPAEAVIFAGDVLFNDGVGRTDFPGGDWKQLLTGIQEKLFPLPDKTRVLPGHGPETTIGRERRSNPFLR